MFHRSAMLTGALASALLLLGCQNAPEQFSIYAPFGPSVVPQPSLSRTNAAPYYTPPADGSGNSPATAGTGNKELSHYDPFRGILVPGNFTPPPSGLRSTETWGTSEAVAITPPRERASTEEPIRIVESGSSSIVATQADRKRSDVQFQASPPSGAVRSGMLLPPPPSSANAAEIATRPKPTLSSPPPAFTPATSSPASSAPAVPGVLTPPTFIPPPASGAGIIPADPRRLSLWDSPRDGSRVMPASHLEEAPRATTSRATTSGTDAWRVRD